jgi:hypothetical protein
MWVVVVVIVPKEAEVGTVLEALEQVVHQFT